MAIRGWLRRYGDVLLAVVFGLGTPLELLGYAGTDRAVALPVGTLAGFALCYRRSAPAATFVAVMVLIEVTQLAAPGFQKHSVFFVALFLLNLYSLGAYARGRSAWVAVPGLLASVVALDIGDGDSSAAGVFFFVVFAGLPWGAGLAVRLRVDRVRELAARNAELQDQARRAVAEERSRIARELHDVVSHAIAVTVLQARGGRKQIGRDEDAVRQALRAIEETNTAALADMRRLLSLLRRADGEEGPEAPMPTLDRLDQLVQQVRSSGLPVEVEVSGQPLPVTPGLDLSAYRIVQEALTNVLKHGGPGAAAHVRLRYGASDLEVEVTNTGAVPDSDGGGHGLIGIRERVAVAGGSVAAGPRPDGFGVHVQLPYLATTT